MGDTNLNPEIKSRLRNHSYRESLTNDNSLKMSGTLPNVEEESEQASTNSNLQTDQKLIFREDFMKKNTTQKLESVADAINKMYDKMNRIETTLEEKVKPTEQAVFDPGQGLLTKVEYLINNATGNETAIQNLVEENIQLREELDMLKGVVHKISKQLGTANSKIDQLVVKSMEDNLVFTGILDDLPKKNPRKQLHEFLYNVMGLCDVRNADLFAVYRMGQPAKDRNRPIVAQCSTDLRRYIQANASILKNRTNEVGAKYYINQQLPDAVSEQKREMREIIKKRKEFEEDLPSASKSKFVIKSGKVYINGQLQRKKLSTPSVEQLFPDDDIQEKIDQIKLKHCHSEPEQGSSFRMAVFRPRSMEDVRLAHIKLFQKFPSADHISVATMVQGEEAYQDDKEHGVGYRMLKIMKQASVDNVALFMIRHYGGINLGPRRFTIIAELTRAALDKLTEIPRESPSREHSNDANLMPSSPVATQQNTQSEKEDTEQD